MFRVDGHHLLQLAELQEFPIPAKGLILGGIRGCLPVRPRDHEYRHVQELTAAVVDHEHPRCTLFLLSPVSGTFAVFPGSTVPHRRYIQEARAKGGRGANCLFPGNYRYMPGMHLAGKPTGHLAFRQYGDRPYRRTRDDGDYDLADPVEIGNPGDNLHAAWCAGVDSEFFGSAGCQVVVGRPDHGSWRSYFAGATMIAQVLYPYWLFLGAELKQLALSGPAGLERCRFGSRGPRTKRVQEALTQRGLLTPPADGTFGPNTLRALLRFQGERDTGVVDSAVARNLGITWP